MKVDLQLVRILLLLITINYSNNILFTYFIFDILALDGWTDPRGNSIWAFLLITSSRKEYILHLEDLSKEHHTLYNISKIIFEIIDKVSSDKFIAIVLDNASNVTTARHIVVQRYKNIFNISCIAHFINLISSDIIKIPHVKSLVKYCNILTKYFKNSYIGGSLLKEAITLKGIKNENLKTYVETRWTTVYDCVNSVRRLKEALQDVYYIYIFFSFIKKK